MKGRRRRAFTLIELVAASALAAMLVLVLFQVIGSFGRTRMALDRSAAEHASAAQDPWKSDMLDMLRWDLANSTERKLEPGRVTLTGHGSLDLRTLASGHMPVVVTYEFERRGGRGFLVRRQAGEQAWTELLCADVTGFSVEQASRARGNAPARVRVDGTRGTLIDEVIIIP